jgi:protein SCO1
VRRMNVIIVILTVMLTSASQLWAAAESAAVRVSLYDLEMQDQTGRTVRFKSDIVSDRLVAIAFTYTTCTTICPILDSIMFNLQRRLGSRLGTDVFLITMSIDPVVDTPSRLMSYSKKLRALPGWTFLTGRKENVDRVLTGLDMYSADILKHQPSIIIGDGRRGVWRRYYGFPSADRIMAGLNELAAGRR